MVTTLDSYDIATLAQLVKERSEVIRKMLESPGLYFTNDRVEKLTAIYSAELVENDALVAKLEAI